MKKTTISILFFAASIYLVGCGGEVKNSGEAVQDSTKVKPKKDTVEHSALYNIPSPIETFTILKITGTGFDKKLMNPAEKKSQYVSDFSKSCNLGIYSTDLSFCFLYKQTQDFNTYLKNINELTTSLGIDGSYGQVVTKRLQANSDNLDSLMQISSDASVNADLYLKENQRKSSTVLISTGAWIEAMHIIVSIATKTEKKEIVSLVADQKVVTKGLLKMLTQFESDADIASVTNDVKDIDAIYQTLKPIKGEATVSEDKTIPSVGDNISYEISKEQLKQILDKVESLRNKLTN